MNALQHAVQYLHKIRRGALLTKNTTFLLYSSPYPPQKNPHTDSFLSTPAELKSKAIKLFPPSLLPGSYQLELIPVCATCKFQKLLWEACFYWNKNKNKAKLAAYSYWFRDPECICLLPFFFITAPWSHTAKLTPCFQEGEKSVFTLGNHLSYSSLQTEESRVITQLTIDARAAQEGEVENRIHSSPKG